MTTDPCRRRSEDGRARFWMVLVVVLAVGAGAGLLVRLGAGPFADPEGCVADVDGVRVEITPEQAYYAGLIAAIAVRRELPARAASIALATAFQESKLRNIAYGDRDSVGLFQQRPSQGWGTVEQLTDPDYAINAFYDELVEIDGYQDMRITEAAQRVQRSGYPEAYEQHAEGARALASALTGWSPARFRCVVEEPEAEAQPEQDNGLTRRAEAVLADVEAAFGDLPAGGSALGGVSAGNLEGSAHDAGRALDIVVRPITPANRRRGWAIAHYLTSRAGDLAIDNVIFDGRIWSSGRRSEAGWRDYFPRIPRSAGAESRAVLEHRDHVHVDVVEGN